MYSHFVLPFVGGVIILFSVIAYKYSSWFIALPSESRKLALRSIFTLKTLSAIWDVIKDSLLHVSIFRHNWLLGFMHASLAFGWFLLIVVGSLEVASVLSESTPMYVHIFFKFFHPVATTADQMMFVNIMDGLLLFVLVGVALALIKRLASKIMGMRKTTRLSIGDRLALISLWLIFPTRLLAESVTSGLYGSGGFLTGTIGEKLAEISFLPQLEQPAWWAYSIVLAVFFVTMPFSRYMHIFTEIPHIFLRRWGVKPTVKASKSDNFQIHACSRCGVCIDTCQMQSELGNNRIQATYFLRNRRMGLPNNEAIHNCLMCGRCENKCPVNIDINTLRLSSRVKQLDNKGSNERYSYLQTPVVESAERVGYFAGCMTHLTPATIVSMNKIFAHLNEQVFFVDKERGVCCGRPLRLAGEVEASIKMVQFNVEVLRSSGITLLVTSCPICLKTFKEDYELSKMGIEVIHHSQYIARAIEQGKIISGENCGEVTYHDPCELGRGLGIYSEPRAVISLFTKLIELPQSGKSGYCCGHSLANSKLLHKDKDSINSSVVDMVKSDTLITACPQCKSAFLANKKSVKVMDLSELVASRLS